MKWEKLDFYTEQYFIDVTKALLNESFINSESNQPESVQYGIGIVERVDMVIRNSENETLVAAALKCLLILFQKEADTFAFHLHNTIGAFSYGGLLNTKIEEVKDFWITITERLNVASMEILEWLRYLAIAAINDNKMAEKMQLIVDLQMDDYDSFQISERLRADYNAINIEIAPDYYLNRLGIL